MARVLGPKGLMPNVKSGTLVKADELLEAVKLSKQGLIEFRVNDGSFIMAKIGQRNFSQEDLMTNYDALTMAIAKKRPESVKGKYFIRSSIKTSMGPAVPVNLDSYIQYVMQSQQ